MKKCCTVYVFRNSYIKSDCTNGGASSKYDKLYVLHPDGWETVPPNAPKDQQCVLRKGPCGNRIIPKTLINEKGFCRAMNGGNIAHCSDSRAFGVDNSICGYHPVKIFDRVER